MTTSKGFKLYMVDIDGSYIDQITDQSIGTDLGELFQRRTTSPYNTFVSVGEQRDTFGFTTTALATALGKVGAAGFSIESGAELVGYFQQLEQGGTFKGTGAHLKITGNLGMIYPQSLSAENNQIATVSYNAEMIFDGTDDPLQFEKDQSLAGAWATDEVFTAGPANINGAAVESVQSLNVDFGITIGTISGDGTGRPTFSYIESIQPIITVVTTDVEQLEDLSGTLGEKATSTSILYLTQMDLGGLRKTGGVHISLTCGANDHMVHISESSASAEGPATATIRLIPIYDGSNAPIVIATNASLPA